MVLPVVVCHQNAFKKNVKNDGPAYAGHTLSFLLTWNDLPMFASSPMSAHTGGAVLCASLSDGGPWNRKKSFKAFMTIISDTFKVTHNL